MKRALRKEIAVRLRLLADAELERVFRSDGVEADLAYAVSEYVGIWVDSWRLQRDCPEEGEAVS